MDIRYDCNGQDRYGCSFEITLDTITTIISFFYDVGSDRVYNGMTQKYIIYH